MNRPPRTITVELPADLYDRLAADASTMHVHPSEHAARIIAAGLAPLFRGLWFRGRPRIQEKSA